VTTPEYKVQQTHERFHGAIFDVVTDEVVMPDGSAAARDYVRHGGAVAVVALDSDEGVMLVRQYRHAVREVLWELPAGLLDVPGEDPVAAAARELGEEAGLLAARWEPLVAVYTSPGLSNEIIRIFLAEELSPTGAEYAYTREFEEAQLTTHVVPLAEAVAMVGRGEITNGPSALGLLAAWHRRRHGTA
jgi:8-oxo-dGTP pyrophosphatase MutT (NUDIX family)